MTNASQVTNAAEFTAALIDERIIRVNRAKRIKSDYSTANTLITRVCKRLPELQGLADELMLQVRSMDTNPYGNRFNSPEDLYVYCLDFFAANGTSANAVICLVSEIQGKFSDSKQSMYAVFAPYYKEYVKESPRGCTGYIHQFAHFLKVRYPDVHESTYMENRKEVAEALNLKF